MPAGAGPERDQGTNVPGWRRHERLITWGLVSWSLLGLILLALACFWLLGTLEAFVIPAVAGTVLAIALDPVVALLQRRHVPRSLGSALVALAVTGLLVALSWVVLGVLVQRAPEFIEAFYEGIADVARMLDAPAAGVWAADSARHAEERVQDFLITGVLPLVGQGLMAGAGLVVSVFIMLSFMWLLLWDGPHVRHWVERLSGLSPHGARRLTGASIAVVRRYLVGMTIVAGINFVIGAACALVAGVDLWLGIAIILFLGTYVPYLGGIAAGVVSVLVALGFGGVDAGVIVLAGVLLINVVVQPWAQTFAVGATLRLRALAVFSLAMLGLLLGGALGGAAAAPLARLVLDARDVVREDRAEAEGRR
jgi:predicted PurR-regulated permease PerM